MARSAAGVLGGQQLNWGWRTLEGELGGLYGACCHIISLANLNHSQTRLGRGQAERGGSRGGRKPRANGRVAGSARVGRP